MIYGATEVASLVTDAMVLPNLDRAGEAYRNLALRVESRLKARGPDAKSLFVTSAESGSGKSVTSLNLALALSEMTDARTLLVDADTTRPSLQEYLRVKDLGESAPENARQGGSEYQPLPIEGYTASVLMHNQIPVQGRAPSVSGLESLARWASENYDLVIFDGPPLFAASAFQLTKFVDGVVLVARAEVTRKRDFEFLLQELGPEKVLGVVLNDSAEARPEHYGYY